MNNVMTLKEDRLNVRIRPDVKEDLRITADLRGHSISGLINSLIVKAIREEKDREPSAFAESQDGSTVKPKGPYTPPKVGKNFNKPDSEDERKAG